MLSPFAPQVGYEFDPEYIDGSVEPRKFDIETVIGYGEMPYPVFTGKEADKLRGLIARLAKPEYSADEIMRRLWLDRQHPCISEMTPNLDFFRFRDAGEAGETIEAISAFVDSLPLWKMQGHSAADMKREKERTGHTRRGCPVRLHPGHDTRRANPRYR